MDEIAQKLLEDVIAEVKENSVQPLSSGLQRRLLDYDQGVCVHCNGTGKIMSWYSGEITCLYCSGRGIKK